MTPLSIQEPLSEPINNRISIAVIAESMVCNIFSLDFMPADMIEKGQDATDTCCDD